MTGIGVFLVYLGYSVTYWALQSMQKNAQPSFIYYLFPLAPKNQRGVATAGGISTPSNPSPAPADTKKTQKAPTGKLPQTTEPRIP